MTMDQYGNLDCERKPPAAEINAELLAALKGVMTWVSNWDCEFKYDPDWPEDEATYLAAIARAEGGAP